MGFNLYQLQPVLDTIIAHSSDHMREITDNVVSLVVTSPPYNARIMYNTYNDNKAWDDYYAMLKQVWQECYRVLRDGGRLCINVPMGIDRNPFHPISMYIILQCLELGFLMRGIIPWDKGNGVLGSAWGSWQSPSNPILRDRIELILCFSKVNMKLDQAETSTKDQIWLKKEFEMLTAAYWRFNPVNRSVTQHPAAFPDELPRRCIKLYSYPGDLILDPFCGIGTTCKVAKLMHRHYIGYDLDAVYAKKAMSNINNVGQLDRFVLKK